ncbi:DUF742 domain-containing protein [Nocardiopsis sp. CNT312]|uniref:DUF742 domain-containing protein n=1 Tax=Nocardiopsis sp. CNT312 TaxID=1137268 RepID=UPI00048C6909|nr:DUF742 domain-containing protein [Nocardiopsis sp. CNT312]
MSRSHRDESPDRLYVITSGRSSAPDDALDSVALIVAENAPTAGMQSEHARILRLCRGPTALVEIAAHLELPLAITRILVTDLLDGGHATARHPRSAPRRARPTTSPDVLEKVLLALQNL